MSPDAWCALLNVLNPSIHCVRQADVHLLPSCTRPRLDVHPSLLSIHSSAVILKSIALFITLIAQQHLLVSTTNIVIFSHLFVLSTLSKQAWG